jgi:hypothetical protein
VDALQCTKIRLRFVTVDKRRCFRYALWKMLDSSL